MFKEQMVQKTRRGVVQRMAKEQGAKMWSKSTNPSWYQLDHISANDKARAITKIITTSDTLSTGPVAHSDSFASPMRLYVSTVKY
jgi:hypothetical protein